MDPIIAELRQLLIENSDEKVRHSGQRFSKEPLNAYDVKTAVIRRIGKACFAKIEDQSKSHIFDICEQLWQSGILEENAVACFWSHAVHEDYEPQDFTVPAYLSHLKKWAESDNRWMRRAAAVSLIIPAKEGKFLEDVLEIADILL